MLAALRIILLSILASILYGEVHDQVTAHLCVEYFSIAHPQIIQSQSPAMLAMAWGIVATWWVGLIIGVPLAICARVGPLRKCADRDLLKPIGLLLASMALLAALAGWAGYYNADKIELLPDLASAIPAQKHAAFMADAFAHMASYGSGFLGGLF